jgi:hypothetical protein
MNRKANISARLGGDQVRITLGPIDRLMLTIGLYNNAYKKEVLDIDR